MTVRNKNFKKRVMPKKLKNPCRADKKNLQK